MTSGDEPSLRWEDNRLHCQGSWNVGNAGALEAAIEQLPPAGENQVALDTAALSRLDMAGAALLHHLIDGLQQGGVEVDLSGLTEPHRRLLALVQRAQAPLPPARGEELTVLQWLGRAFLEKVEHSYTYLAFVGDLSLQLLPRLLWPLRMRWGQVVHEMRVAGVHALPIIGLLTFLMGIVIAYQGGTMLEQYGANVFVIDLVVITMLREMAPLVVAIVVAGRTGSAYTAQIGTMMVTEEIDALRTLAIKPVEILAVPKVVALVIALPLITVYADLLGVLGGVFIANLFFDVSLADFMERIPQVVDPSTFWVGIVKAPVFAFLIASIGCHQGFRVHGSAAGVGRATTASVVQSIFLVIVTDAAFSIVFNRLGL